MTLPDTAGCVVVGAAVWAVLGGCEFAWALLESWYERLEEERWRREFRSEQILKTGDPWAER